LKETGFFAEGRMMKVRGKKNDHLYMSFMVFLLIVFSSANLCASVITLSWSPPTTNSDNTPLTDLASYKIHYGTLSGYYTQSIDVGNLTSYQMSIDENIYYFAVTAVDTKGNESVYSQEVNTASLFTDSTPPVISGVYASNITGNSVEINWTTDEEADTQVEYGTTLSYGYKTALNTSLLTTHHQILDVSPSTLYHYRVLSRDASGNGAVSEDFTFTTAAPPDTTPPIISNVEVHNITETSVTITWTTDEPSTSQVEYGLNTAYEHLTHYDLNFVTIHTVDITGLSSHTAYDFRVRSKDSAGNESLSENHSFTTSNRAPAIEAFSADPATGYATLQVNFTASASDDDGHIVKFEWDLDGDGYFEKDSGSLPSASAIYEREGKYKAKARVTDNGGASSLSSEVTVTVGSHANQLPVISSFTAVPLSGAAPLPVTFTVVASDPDGSIELYEWDFDGNSTYDASTHTTPVFHTYKTSGIYTVKVRVTDNYGGSTAGEITVTVKEGSTDTPGKGKKKGHYKNPRQR
jgi:PKD repeat protein